MKTKKSLGTKVLWELKKAGSHGVVNSKLSEITLRYGAVIFNLRSQGYDIKTESVPNAGRKNTYKYTLLSPNPVSGKQKEKGLDVLTHKLSDLGLFFTLEEVEQVIKDNGLVVVHKANERNVSKGGKN